MPRLRVMFAVIAMTVLSCTSKGHSDLKNALSVAVKEKKLSEKQMRIILKEYDILREEDREKAKIYVEQVVKAVEMGGDSTHINAVRRVVTGKRRGV